MLAIWYLGKGFCSKNLRDTVLAIWDLGRVSFQSKQRDTVLAIWYLGRVWGPRPTPKLFGTLKSRISIISIHGVAL